MKIIEHVASKTIGSQVTSHLYDVFGHFKSATLPSNKVISYKTDGENKRFARIVNGAVSTLYSYNNQGQLVSEHDADGTLRSRYMYGTQAHSPDYMIKDNLKYSLIKDHLGSIRFVMNASTGAIAQQLNYDEFGMVTQDTSPQFQTFGYAGGLYDSSTGLLRFSAREYDAESGRRLQKDPIRFQGGDTNLYGYVVQDPINYIDPRGENPVAIAFAVGFVVGAASTYSVESQINPNSSTLSRLRAAVTGGLLTGSGVALGAVTVTSAFVTGVLTASGLSLSLLNAPGDAGVNSKDLSNGIKYFQNLNRQNKKENKCSEEKNSG